MGDKEEYFENIFEKAVGDRKLKAWPYELSHPNFSNGQEGRVHCCIFHIVFHC